MFQGQLLGIYIAAKKATALHPIDQAEAIAGQGLVGDRYFLQEGTFTKPGHPDREVTLIEMEAIEALGRDSGVKLEPGQARRNLVTQGVPLNHLVGLNFTIGTVQLRGIRLCEPCAHLEGLTAQGVKDGLCHRGGLRAQILSGGVLRIGDPIHSS